MKHHQQTFLSFFKYEVSFTCSQGVTTEALLFFDCQGQNAGTFFVYKSTTYNQIQKISMTIVLGMSLFCIFQTILVKCIYKIICRIMDHKENQKCY
jgi:hypothetical protein